MDSNYYSSKSAAAITAAVVVAAMMAAVAEGAQWCIARSVASATALQTALDYACGVGAADCLPIQPNGLCYLPNSLPAHASYAFNSFYQRSGAAPGACDFAGTGTVSITDPSYGSCTYPASKSTAGGSTSPNTNTPATTLPGTNTPTSPGLGDTWGGGGIGNAGGLPPGPPLPDTETSSAASISICLLSICCCMSLLLL